LEVGRDEEAREVVYQLHGDKNRDTAESEYREMYDTIKAEAQNRSRRLSDLWATRAMARRTFVAVGVQVFCQFSGINGVSTSNELVSKIPDFRIKSSIILARKCMRVSGSQDTKPSSSRGKTD
jgi:hypothetical protein